MGTGEDIEQAKRGMRVAMLKARGPAFQRHGARALARLDVRAIASTLAARARKSATPGTVSAYVAMRDELDAMPVAEALLALGWRLVLPVVTGKAQPLRFRSWTPGEPTVAAGFGTREPPPGSPEFDPDVLLVPLLAFDESGYRLGYGGGYYDRTLSALRSRRSIVAIGVAYDEQWVARVPRDRHDERLDAVLTPSGIRDVH